MKKKIMVEKEVTTGRATKLQNKFAYFRHKSLKLGSLLAVELLMWAC